MLHVWYPSDSNKDNEPAEYIPSRSRAYISLMLKQGRMVPGFIEAAVKTNSFKGLPFSTNCSKAPVIVFSPGFGNPCYMYTSLFEDLASHGFVVAAVDHTYRVEPVEFPHGRITPIADEFLINLTTMEKFEHAAPEEMKTWVADLRFVLDEIERINSQDRSGILTQMLDVERIGACGHSFGGAAVIQLARTDSRIKAVVDLDGSLFGENRTVGFDKPCMLIGAGDYTVPEPVYEIFGGKQGFDEFFERHINIIKQFYDNLTNDKYLITLKHAQHMTFSDMPTIKGDNPKQIQAVGQIRHLMLHFLSTYLAKEVCY